MTNFTKLALGLTGLTALAAVSSPAAAQTNPYGYGNNGGVVGAIVNAVTGYGQYPQGNYGYEQMGQRNSVEMCARTAEQRLNSDGRYGGYNNRYAQDGYYNRYAQDGYYNGYAQDGYYNGYGQNGYHNGGTFRVVGITNVERRMNGGLRVHGIASSDRYGYGNNGYRSAGTDYRFTCKIDWRGAVTSLDFDRGMRGRRG